MIHFAMYRADLQTKAAQQIMRKYQGQQLFPMDKDAEMLTEYLLTRKKPVCQSYGTIIVVPI